VVAGRHDVRAAFEQPGRELGRQPRAVGRVLAVDDAEAGAELVPQLRQARLDGAPARRAEDVGDEEDSQSALR